VSVAVVVTVVVFLLLGRLLHNRRLCGARCTNATEVRPTGEPTLPSHQVTEATTSPKRKLQTCREPSPHRDA
jgi:hypothetical protein